MPPFVTAAARGGSEAKLTLSTVRKKVRDDGFEILKDWLMTDIDDSEAGNAAAGAKLKSEFLISDEEDLRRLFPATNEIAVRKCLNYVDKHARSFIERSPFMCIGTQSGNGRADVSPRGDPCGFVKILDDRTLLIPDRPGNNRLDTLSNITTNPNVGLLFMVPGFDDTMRVNGHAQLTRDPDILSLMAVNDRIPTIAIAVHVEEVFIHCAKAFRRSKLWQQDHHQDRKDVPSLMNIILDQTTGAPADPEEVEKLDAGLEEKYRKSMY
ncbi:pyridoxamine 5'-phosphate oxidase family protein [uncultured Jannaschia sp.]|uniref:pyridoxamine 5'-phosphate oxidase family protein n=1 Tax=uncultured Jannaschia sp. TaxID=293347 RepID=UPI00260C0AA9|nr:pyridoxamine 5'-phosphate oxidase family protein [uncultured Jannaschia sp.]